jgi:hypothetical protein
MTGTSPEETSKPLFLQSARLRPRIVPIFFLAILWAIASIWSAEGGALHYEAQLYLPYHLSGTPLVQRLFDSKILDQGMYQARELSYAADAVDCHFIALSARLGVPHFLSLTYYVCVIIITLLLWRFFRADLSLDPAVAAALILLFLASPVVFLSGSYFRSSKILVCLFCMLLIPKLYRVLRQEHANRWDGCALAAIGFAGTLADRQGFYLLVCLAAFLAAYWLARRTRSAAVALAAAVAACTLAVAYNDFFAPRMTLLLNGYWPSFWYQHLPWARFLETPAAYIAVGARLFMGSAAFLFGNLPALLAAIPLAAILWLVHKGFGGFWAAIAAAGIAALIVMDTLMVVRHGALVWDDVQRVYYWLPQTLLLVVLAGFAAGKPWVGSRLWILRGILLLMLAANVASLPAHRAIVRNVHGEERTLLGQRVRRALITGQAPPDIAANPVYQALR